MVRHRRIAMLEALRYVFLRRIYLPGLRRKIQGNRRYCRLSGMRGSPSPRMLEKGGTLPFSGYPRHLPPVEAAGAGIGAPLLFWSGPVRAGRRSFFCIRKAMPELRTDKFGICRILFPLWTGAAGFGLEQRSAAAATVYPSLSATLRRPGPVWRIFSLPYAYHRSLRRRPAG